MKYVSWLDVMKTTPTRERLEELISAGLGKAKLVFPDKKADP